MNTNCVFYHVEIFWFCTDTILVDTHSILGKPGVKTGSFKNPDTCIILATCLTTTDPVLKVKNRNIFVEEEQRLCGGRMRHTSPKAFLSFN